MSLHYIISLDLISDKSHTQKLITTNLIFRLQLLHPNQYKTAAVLQTRLPSKDGTSDKET